MRLVKIEWVDSYGVGQDWKPVRDVSDVRHICISVGFLAKDGEHVKVIVPHLSPANELIDAEEQGCGDMAIPVSAIVRMTDLLEVRESSGETKEFLTKGDR